MSDQNSPKERRLHPRYSVEGEIQLGKQGAATLSDLSMSGLSCLSPVPFDEMAVLEVSMTLPDGGPLKVGGAVVRCQPAKQGGWTVAVFFTHMDEDNTERLKRFIDSQQRG